MPTFHWGTFAAVALTALVALVALHTATFLIGRRLGRYNVVDVVWGLGFVLIALIAALFALDLPRALLLLVLVTIWGLRLSKHMVDKTRGKGEDPRYQELLGENPAPSAVIRKIFATQAGAHWFVGLPLMVSAAVSDTGTWSIVLAALGTAVWLLGFVFEAVGDRQLAKFKADPANKGKVMDKGLWAWTRHPNYFGDSSVWWGIWLVSAGTGFGLATVLSPVVMTYFLVFATGARLLEKSMSKRPGYPEYQQRTSYFLPRPPRSR